MLALALAALVAQISPTPEATTATLPPESQIIRRMPATQPRVRSSEAIIRNSGSTNTGGYTIVVHADFSADIADALGRPRRAVVGAPQAKWLFAKVREAMPLDALPVERCVKSASFGTTLSISYDGTTTPDLSCGGAAVVRELSRTAAVIAQQIGATVRIGRPLP